MRCRLRSPRATQNTSTQEIHIAARPAGAGGVGQEHRGGGDSGESEEDPGDAVVPQAA